LRESPRAGRQLLSILKRGGLLAMVIDQDTRAPSVTVPFLGHPARTPFAPAALAIRRGVPLMVTYAARLPSGRLRIVLNPPIPAPASGDRNDDIIRMTELVNDQLSAAIRDNPESWVWWHRRWRRKPIPELDMDAKIPYPNSILSDSEEVNQ
jgi:KDO2-lipid IV(A) lauroyltransferase